MSGAWTLLAFTASCGINSRQKRRSLPRSYHACCSIGYLVVFGSVCRTPRLSSLETIPCSQREAPGSQDLVRGFQAILITFLSCSRVSSRRFCDAFARFCRPFREVRLSIPLRAASRLGLRCGGPLSAMIEGLLLWRTSFHSAVMWMLVLSTRL